MTEPVAEHPEATFAIEVMCEYTNFVSRLIFPDRDTATAAMTKFEEAMARDKFSNQPDLVVIDHLGGRAAIRGKSVTSTNLVDFSVWREFNKREAARSEDPVVKP